MTVQKKIKVANLTSAHPHDDIRIFHKQSVSLLDSGYEVYLIATNCVSQYLQGVHIVGVERTGKGRFRRMLTTTRSVYKKALEVDADIYHFHDPELLPYGLKLRKKGKIVVYDAHEDLPKQVMDKPWIPTIFRGIVSQLINRYELNVAKQLSGVISVTETICDRFRTVNSNVQMVANYPLFHEIEQLSELDNVKVPGQICYVGNLFPKRGVLELVDALNYTDATLVLAGKFSTQEFEDQVKANAGWKKVNYLGHLDRKQVMEILATSQVGMVTLHPTKSYLEALPIKMFEYMSAGIPVIASDFPLWRSIIEKESCGVCVDPLNPKEIGEAINNLICNPIHAQQMGINGFNAFKSHYNWNAEKDKLIKFYSLLISSKMKSS
jgi:glycosyltransferase involved in cell wall biosynthesis